MSFGGLSLEDDDQWACLIGGYRALYDPREALQALRVGKDVDAAWRELWDELHHQNDVDTASYAAVPWLVRIHEERGVADWNTYGLLITIELAQGRRHNPPIPEHFKRAYDTAWKRLTEIALTELEAAEDETLVSCIIAVLAIGKGHRELGRFAAEFDEEERKDIFKEAGW
jgi:hypothetical protein